MSFFFEELDRLGTREGEVEVRLSNDLVRLLSEQLYKSPEKALEELVVNSYDADAEICRVAVPQGHRQMVVVFDDGIGMDEQGLSDLWHIGRSNKRTAEIEKRMKRKQIGKFGIGKLATYTIAEILTYISRIGDDLLSVSVDFSHFRPRPGQTEEAIRLPVIAIRNTEVLAGDDLFKHSCQLAGVDPRILLKAERSRPWTMAVLEKLRRRSRQLKVGRLRWVLSTAMPLVTDFRLYLNRRRLESAKLDYVKIVEFDVSEMPEWRLQTLEKVTREEWQPIDGALVSSKSFKDGVRGTVLVTKKTLEGKSDDIGRSNGFFVYIRRRLINEHDGLFGIEVPKIGLLSRFHAKIFVDGLDDSILASRDEVNPFGRATNSFKALLKEILNEARARYDKANRKKKKKDSHKPEAQRSFVDQKLVERPMADFLSRYRSQVQSGNEIVGRPLYTSVPAAENFEGALESLYSEKRRAFLYRYTSQGREGAMATFDPVRNLISINDDHDFVAAHADNPRSQVLLEDVVTAEILLEAYLTESGAGFQIINDVVSHRDRLFRSLAKDHPFSFNALARNLEEAAADERKLEFALVAAARAMGFQAKHISGSGEPDGLAVLRFYPEGKKIITLEAKSSTGTPELPNIDFAGIAEHVRRSRAHGCLLVSPSYPGPSRGNDSAAAERAQADRISCWTIRDLARFLRKSEEKRLTARDMLDIVLGKFTPNDVHEAITEILRGEGWSPRELQEAVVRALVELADRMPDAVRTVDMVAATVTFSSRFRDLRKEDIETALQEVASVSGEAMEIKDGVVDLRISAEEVLRRISPFEAGPYSPSFFKKPAGGDV